MSKNISIEPAISDSLPAADAIKVTPAAKAHILQKLAQHQQGTGICLGVKQAGCSGLKYALDYVDDKPEQAFVFPLTDTANIYVPVDSFPFVKGSVVDYVKQGLSTTLKIINPNEAGSCGCGESFTIDETS